ncbi:MAG: hypothetical protein ACK55I_23570, partial [bacterium]
GVARGLLAHEGSGQLAQSAVAALKQFGQRGLCSLASWGRVHGTPHREQPAPGTLRYAPQSRE